MLKHLFNYLKGSTFLARCILLPVFTRRFLAQAWRESSFWFLRHYPGHYSSTLPSAKGVRDNWAQLQKQIANQDDGVDLNAGMQRSLLEVFSAYYTDFSPPENPAPGRLYHSRNEMFGFNDAFILYCLLRHYRPRQIVEVGSGYSSGLMLDTAEELSLQTVFTFVDPYSTTILQVLENKPAVRHRLVRTPVQEVDPELFTALGEGDVLFIDSSHVLKIGSDLTSILFNIVPKLRKGVLVHFHDIWYPFEYPQEMVLQGRAWNEVYFVRSFLQFNSSFRVLFFGAYADKAFSDFIARNLPRYAEGNCNSLWLVKIA